MRAGAQVSGGEVVTGGVHRLCSVLCVVRSARCAVSSAFKIGMGLIQLALRSSPIVLLLGHLLG